MLQEGSALQELTANSSSVLAKISSQLPAYALDREYQEKVQHQCYEIVGVGYLVVRYQHLQDDPQAYLKFGVKKKFGHYVTIVPFEGVGMSPEKKALTVTSNALKVVKDDTDSKSVMVSENSYQISFPEHFDAAKQSARLDLQSEKLLYCCPEH